MSQDKETEDCKQMCCCGSATEPRFHKKLSYLFYSNARFPNCLTDEIPKTPWKDSLKCPDSLFSDWYGEMSVIQTVGQSQCILSSPLSLPGLALLFIAAAAA